MFPTVEHAFAAAKTLNKTDKLAISQLATPAQAKRFGRKVLLRPEWDDIRIDIMYSLLLLKFEDPVLKQKLAATAEFKLVETNSWNDTFWGVCDNKGSNHLGRLLMKVRDQT